MAERVILRASDVSWCSSGEKESGVILDRCSVDIRQGDWISLIGPNGSGKSTLLQVLSGNRGFCRNSFSGEIRWQDSEWTKLHSRERATRIAYVSSEFNSVFPLKVIEVVESGAFASGDLRNVHAAVSFCDLGALINRGMDSLSSGERQRVALARALVQGAEVLFLDEAFSNMDLDYQLELGARLKGLVDGSKDSPFLLSAVVLVSHDFSLCLRWANRAWVIHRGKTISSGPIKEALSEHVLRVIYPKASPYLLFQK
ncbi:MAG: ABC transporter ATP-binding protein [Bdellovibrionales bacterium]|nr:ABC transporter ATP-binding protein [Bdellovibrionales bacterium]